MTEYNAKRFTDWSPNTLKSYIHDLEEKHEREIGIARSALAQYGHHLGDCLYFRQVSGCTCGYKQALGQMDLEQATAYRWMKP